MFPHSPFVQERRRSLRVQATCITISLWLQLPQLSGQANPQVQNRPPPHLEDVGNVELGALLNQHLRTRDLFSAAPVLVEFRKRMDAGELPQKNLDKISYYIGLGYMQGYSKTNVKSWLLEAVKEFQHYLDHFPHGVDIHYVLANKADCHRGNSEFLEAIPILELLLDRGRPHLAKLPSTLRMELLEKLVQACTYSKEWDKAIPWANKFLIVTGNPGQRTMAAATLVEAYVAKGRFDEIDQLLPFMDSNNRYRIDPRLNYQFLMAGDHLASEKQHAKASLFYSLTMTPRDMAAAYSSLLEDMSVQLLPLETKKRKYGANFPQNEEKLLAHLQFERDALIRKMKRVHDMLKDPASDYSKDLLWRKATNYKAMGRDWEAYFAFLGLVWDYPGVSTDLREKYMYALFIMALRTEKRETAIQIAKEMLGNPDFRTYGAEVGVFLADLFLKEGAEWKARAKSSPTPAKKKSERGEDDKGVPLHVGDFQEPPRQQP